MKYILLLLLLLLSLSVQSKCYVDVGIGVHDLSADSYMNGIYRVNDKIIAEEINNPLGIFEAGCKYDNKTYGVLHISSVQQNETGLTMLFAKVNLF